MHKECEKCQWNNYPTCNGTIMDDGSEMNIENLKDSFQCGQKDDINITDFSIRVKSDLELRIEVLEEKTKDLDVRPL